MFIRLLGSVGAGHDQQQVRPAPGAIAASVLAHLALGGGRLVTVDGLIDSVWDVPPPSARNAVQVAVGKLRKLYGDDLVRTDRTGYRISSGVAQVDLLEVEQLLANARRNISVGQHEAALGSAEAAIALFVGEPLSGVLSSRGGAARQHAENLWAMAQLERARALMALDRGDDAVVGLQHEVGRNPLDEPAHALLMDALTVTGRPADALMVYERVRRRLADELGVDPSPPIREAFERALDPAARPAPLQQSLPRQRVVLLPATGGALIGREDTAIEITELFASGQRLVTLVGAGGLGKTRLAVAVGHRMAEQRRLSVIFVDLTIARDPGAVNAAAAAAVKAENDDILSALGSDQTLMVLDNAEHVLPAVADLAKMLLTVGTVSVLVTSRTRLKLRDERVIWLDPLQAESADGPAVQLLVQRAGLNQRSAAAQLPELHALARRADGIPLVLELLASALNWQTPQQLLAHLDETLLQLSDDARDRPSRHLSVQAAVDWSLQLASPAARAALGALTLPRGTFGLDTAEAIVGAALPSRSPASVIAELVDLALLQRLPDPGSIRFRLLEPIRLHALQAQLVPEPGDDVHRAHAIHYFGRLTAVQARLRDDSLALVDLMRREDANLAAAINWTWLNDRARAMASMAWLLAGWWCIGRYELILTWSERALADDAGTSLERAEVALRRLSALTALDLGRDEELDRLLAQVAGHAHLLDDESHSDWVNVNVQFRVEARDFDGAMRWLGEHRLNEPRLRWAAIRDKAIVFGEFGHYQEMAGTIDSVLQAPGFRDRKPAYVFALNDRAWAALALGDLARAHPLLSEAMTISVAEELATLRSLTQHNQAWVASAEGAHVGALQLIFDDLEAAARVDQRTLFESLIIAGLALYHLRQIQPAGLVASAAAHLAEELKPYEPYVVSRFEELLRATSGKRQEASIEDAIQVIRHSVATAGDSEPSSGEEQPVR